MNDTQKIEKHIAKLFLERTEGIGINDAALIPGKTKNNEPDILYEDKGLEVGAVLRGTNTLIDIYEKEFLSKVSEAINGRIPDTMQIRLVMQDDRDTIEHTAIPDFQNYQHLPRYLDGFFVYRFENERIQDKVVLNQKTRMRAKTFPKIKNARKFQGFVDELVNYVNSLKPSDFTKFGEFSFHHRMITDGRDSSQYSDLLEDFISPNIIDKLRKNKYSGPYQKQILLLHNYSMLGNTKFSTDIHFYTHHRNDIFNLIWKYINQYNSFSFYNGISFLDFSNYAFNQNFDLLDFKKFSLIQPSEFLYGYDEIRVELRPPENNND